MFSAFFCGYSGWWCFTSLSGSFGGLARRAGQMGFAPTRQLRNGAFVFPPESNVAVQSAGGGLPEPRSFWRETILTSDPRRRRILVAATLGLVLIVGLADYLMGFEASLQAFYFVPVCLAVASVGWRFGVFTAVASVVSWLAGDFAAGAHFANRWVLGWNALFSLGTYFVVIWMFAAVLRLQREMEERVLQRTAALRKVIAERERLEKALLDIAERERRSIGHDLHDGLGQHLTGTALAAQVLGDKLQAKHLEEEHDAWKVVSLIEEGIEQTRRLARGLLLPEIQRDSLVPALQELAADMSHQFRVACEFICEHPVHLAQDDSATHLFRIAQEAVRNAIRHGKARRIVIVLSEVEGVTLTVRDYGVGLSERHGDGLGLSIMAHRAEIIGGQFAVARQREGGTLVTCHLPALHLAP